MNGSSWRYCTVLALVERARLTTLEHDGASRWT
jgi:hypothetical protein